MSANQFKPRKHLNADALISQLRSTFEELPDPTPHHSEISLADALMSGFARNSRWGMMIALANGTTKRRYTIPGGRVANGRGGGLFFRGGAAAEWLPCSFPRIGNVGFLCSGQTTNPFVAWSNKFGLLFRLLASRRRPTSYSGSLDGL